MIKRFILSALFMGVAIAHAETMTAPSYVQEAIAPKPVSTLWKVSIVSLGVTSALDVHSSWGKLERNGLLAGSNGRFGVKGLMVKSGLTAGLIVGEYLIIRKYPKSASVFKYVNFGGSIAYAGVAQYNYGNHR